MAKTRLRHVTELKRLARWMRLLLEARSMSISELARRTGRNRIDVTRSLQGRHAWGYDRLIDYAQAMKLEVKDLTDIPAEMTRVSAFHTVFRPIIEWALVRPYDRGLSVPQGI